VFTGASQFSAVSVISAGGSVASAVSGGLLLAARNGVYGLALSPSIKGSLARRMLAAQFVIDETTAMTSAAPDQRSKDWAFWSCAVMLFACWNLGTLVGALAGSSIDPETFGLDAAFPVVFVAMVAPHLATRSGRRAALIGAAVTIVLTPFLPIGLPILLSSVGVFVGLLPRDDAGMPGRPAGEAP
jgi:4-azaleucine resistance transporter AzlC